MQMILMFENMKPKISIVDYGLCNLYNVSNALEHIGAQIEIIDKPKEVKIAKHIILPGVGAVSYTHLRAHET